MLVGQTGRLCWRMPTVWPNIESVTEIRTWRSARPPNVYTMWLGRSSASVRSSALLLRNQYIHTLNKAHQKTRSTAYLRVRMLTSTCDIVLVAYCAGQARRNTPPAPRINDHHISSLRKSGGTWLHTWSADTATTCG